MNKVRMNCSYCGRKCSLDKDFCILQDGVYVCKSCYNWQKKVSDKDMAIENWKTLYESVIQSCRNGIEENKRLEKQLAECNTRIVKEMELSAERRQIIEDLTIENRKLKQQLVDKDAEHELLIKQFEEETENLRKQIKQESDARKRFVEEVKNLKQQLVEKDAERELDNSFWKQECDSLQKALAEKENLLKMYPRLEDMYPQLPTIVINNQDKKEIDITNEEFEKEVEKAEQKIKQDKISFCIKQLEKVKELLLIQTKEYPIVYNISDDIVGGAIDRDKCFNIIDNKIKQLKEMK